MDIQLWSYNFDPEPTGIGIVSTVWARGLRDRGHRLSVVAAHPHYPEPVWGNRPAAAERVARSRSCSRSVDFASCSRSLPARSMNEASIAWSTSSAEHTLWQ